MKKRLLMLLLGSLCVAFLAAGCKANPAIEEEILAQVGENTYIAQTEEGTVYVGFDEEGNPVGMMDEKGNILAIDGASVEKDEKGKIVSVTTKEGNVVTIKEKVVREEAQAPSEEKEEAEVTDNKKTSEVSSDKKKEEDSVKIPEKETKKADVADELIPGVNAPPLTPNAESTSNKGLSEEVIKQMEKIKASTLAEMEKERGLDDSKINATLNIVMYTRADDTGGNIRVYKGPGEEYGAVSDNGREATIPTYPLKEFAVQVLSSTDNGWYKIKYVSTKGKYAYSIAAEHDVEGYVRQTDLVSEEENTTRVSEKAKIAESIRIQAEKDVEKYEKELAEKEKKIQEEKEKKASEKEKASEKVSEKTSEETSEAVSEEASEKTSEKASEKEETSKKEEENSETSSEQKEITSETGSEVLNGQKEESNPSDKDVVNVEKGEKSSEEKAE